MMTILSFMEKIYSDTKTLSMIYIIGSILLFIFIVLLIISLRKPEKKPTKIIEEPDINNDENKEEIKTETITEQKEEIISKSETEIIPEAEENKVLENILNVEESKEENKLEEKEEEQKEDKTYNISTEIPSIDEYVDNIVNKTYEKNEQFSSVYVNTDTIKLEKVLDKLNVDDDIKEAIVPDEEKIKKEEKEELSDKTIEEKTETNKIDDLKNKLEEQKINNSNKLDNLKKALENNKTNVNNKQDDLKNKLDALKNNNTNKLDDLKSKLDNLKNQ